LSDLQLHADAVSLLGNYANALENLFLEAGLFHAEREMAGRKGTKVINAVVIRGGGECLVGFFVL